MREAGSRAPLAATFFAFRARKGVLLFPSALLYLVGVAAILVAFTLANHDDLRAWLHGGPPPVLAQIWPSAALALLLQRIWAAAWEAGALRWMILGERGGVFGLSFGAATFRVLAVHLCWAAYLALAAAILWLVDAGLDAASTRVGALADSAAWFFRDIAFPGLKALAAVALTVVAVKLSPAAALTVALDRFAFFAAWRITRGRFISLSGSSVALACVTTGLAGAGAAVLFFYSSQGGTTFVSLSVAAALIATALTAWLSLARFGVAARAVQAAAEEG